MNKETYLEKAVDWAEKKAIVSLKSISEGYESPQVFISKTTKDEIQADLSFVTHGGVKHYSVIALKNDNQKKTVAKWKVLSFLASMKKGNLHLLVPDGHKPYTLKLVNKFNINAVIHML
tara:strand:+ start:845 stop:1201 length:357 start_codon:yes stop_codon:yes gene_type:complete